MAWQGVAGAAWLGMAGLGAAGQGRTGGLNRKVGPLSKGDRRQAADL